MTLSEGIVKINSKTLESSELKKYDKLEKEGIAHVGAIQKGKQDTFWFLFFFLFQVQYVPYCQLKNEWMQHSSVENSYFF